MRTYRGRRPAFSRLFTGCADRASDEEGQTILRRSGAESRFGRQGAIAGRCARSTHIFQEEAHVLKEEARSIVNTEALEGAGPHDTHPVRGDSLRSLS